VNLQSNFAVYVLIFVMHVLKNVKDIQIWIIVSNVLKHVENVLMNVEEWLVVVKELDNQRKLFSITFYPFFFWQ